MMDENVKAMNRTLNDESILTFGNLHKGKRLIDVPASYLLFIYENNYNTGIPLRVYIEDNLDVLKKQKDEEPKY